VRTDDAQLDGKFRLRSDEAVAMWKVTGPQNATLRAIVSLQHCLPISEETFSLAPGTLSHLLCSPPLPARKVGELSEAAVRPYVCLSVHCPHVKNGAFY